MKMNVRPRRMASDPFLIEAENRLHQHNQELLREEFQYRTEARRAGIGLIVELSITVAIMLEVIIALLHSVLPGRVAILLGAGLAIGTVAFVLYARNAGTPIESEWQQYASRLEAEFQRHQEALRGL